MLYLIVVFFLIFLIPVTVYATHQDYSTQCSVSIGSEIISIVYINEERNNPDKSFYPGDGFHFLFTFTGIPECLSFTVKPLESEGIFNVISHDSITWNKSYTTHGHNDFEMQAKYLTTFHYYKILDVTQECTVHRGGLRSCDTPSYTLDSNPIFSYREDKELTDYDIKKIENYRKSSEYLKTETQAWGFTNMKGEHGHDEYSHINESDESIESFENYIISKCSNLEKYSGCVFGHVELESEMIQEKCMFEELEKINVSHDIENDFCVNVNHNISLGIEGTKLSCSDEECKTVKVKRSSNAKPNILSSEFDILLSKPPVKDRDNYDGKNKDDTYYPHDPIGIIHNPSLLWKDFRSETIQFVTTKQYDLKKEYDFDCKNNKCEHVLKLDSVYPALYDFGNGEGITIYNSTRDNFGIFDYKYSTTMTNIGYEIYTVQNTINSETVDYNPLFESYPYPLLLDNQELAFDDRQALALHYLGSGIKGEQLYEERRSKINYVYNVDVGYDPFVPHILTQNFTLNEGITVSENTLLSHNQSAVFSQSGYGKIYFEHPLSDIIIPDNFSKFENVTSYTTLFSIDFAGKDTILNHYEMRYPEAAFTKNLIIKSVNQNGTLIDDLITVSIGPYFEIGAEYIIGYISDKINFDTNDVTFAEIISNDTYPMNQNHSDYGMLNVTIFKTGIFFDEYVTQSNTGNSEFSNKITDLELLIETPDEIRLSAPYDIGLSMMSPTSITINVNDIENTINKKYYSFGEKQTIIINTQKDNQLQIDRDFGKIIIYQPSNFGLIHTVSIDGEIVKQKCSIGCVLLFQPSKELNIIVENIWGGTASIISPELIPFMPPQTDDPNYQLIGAIFMILIFGFIIYKFFKQKK